MQMILYCQTEWNNNIITSHFAKYTKKVYTICTDKSVDCHEKSIFRYYTISNIANARAIKIKYKGPLIIDGY